MGNSAASALNEAASRCTGVAIPPNAPHSGPEALSFWRLIDPERVDVGRYEDRVWAARTRLEVNRMKPLRMIKKAHGKYIRALVWDPFRDLLISGGGDGWIRLWDTVSHTATGGFDTKLGVRSLLVLREELISGHGNGDVTVWAMDFSAKPHLQALKGHTEAVYSLATLTSGDLVTGSNDIRIYTRDALEGFRLCSTHPHEILCICAVPGTSLMVTGNMNALVSVWETDVQGSERQGSVQAGHHSWELSATCQGHSRAVWSVCYVDFAKCVVTGGADHNIRVWDIATWSCKCILSEHTNWVVGFAVGPGCLLSCSNDTTVRAWDVKTWECMRTFTEHQYEVYCVCVFGGGRFASSGAQRLVLLYGGQEHTGDLARLALKSETDDLPAAREQQVNRSNGGSPRPTEGTTTKTGHGSLDATTMEPAPLRGLMAEAVEKIGRQKATLGEVEVKKVPATYSGYPTQNSADSSEQRLKQKRANLMANSNLDITISDFRRQLISTKDPTGVGGRLPNISENDNADCNIDRDWGVGSAHLPTHSPGTVESVGSVSSVRSAESMASTTSRNSAFQSHSSYDHSTQVNEWPARRPNVSPSVLDDDSMMLDTRRAGSRHGRSPSPRQLDEDDYDEAR